MKSDIAPNGLRQGLSTAEFTPLLSSLLPSVSRSFYLSLRFLPAPVREPLGLAYLLARTSDTIADTSLAPLEARMMALDLFSSALNEESGPPRLAHAFLSLSCTSPAEQSLLQKADTLLCWYRSLSDSVQNEIRSVLKTIIGGQREDLMRFGYASAASIQTLPRTIDTERYTYAVAGCVGEFWTRICSLQIPSFATQPLESLLSLGREFGQGLQLINILRDMPEDLKMGRCYLPAQELEAEHLSPQDLLSRPQKARSLFFRWLDRAELSLTAGESYVSGIKGRGLRFSVALPRRIGLETIALMRTTPPLETDRRIRISRAAVMRCAWHSLRE